MSSTCSFCVLPQERCTKLEHALYAAKSDAAAATQSASAAAEQVQALQAQLQQSQQLVKQLEADLLAFSTSSSSGLETGTAFLTAAAGTGGADMVSGRSGLEGLVHNSTADQQEAGSPTAVNVAAAAGTDAAAAVLQAVTAQRDRFRARMSELEAEQAGVAARLQQALAQVDAVTKDNVALVEKIRCGSSVQVMCAPDVGKSGHDIAACFAALDGV
jgi:homeobox protein cut-like